MVGGGARGKLHLPPLMQAGGKQKKHITNINGKPGIRR